jgi:glutamyl-tRNA reductase
MEVQEIIRDYLEKLYSNKFKNLKEMDRFLDTFDHLKLNQEEINHLKRSLTQNEIESAIKTLSKKHSPKRKVQDLMDSLLNSIRPLKKN